MEAKKCILLISSLLEDIALIALPSCLLAFLSTIPMCWPGGGDGPFGAWRW